MILVTGTKRSGTSMWMQILKAAGFPVIGEAFMGHWEQSIKNANPHGFYESSLRRGIYYATNPNPETGAYILPEASRDHVVKVFIPGVIRTDRAFIDKVIITVRSWRAYSESIQHLYALEDEWLAQQGPDEKGRDRLELARARRGKLPPAAEWWFETFELIRDLITRRYPVRFVSYERLLLEPQTTISPILDWLGRGDHQAACAAVQPDLRHHHPDIEADDGGVEQECIEVFDQLVATIHDDKPMDATLLQALNATQARMDEKWGHLPRNTDL